MAYRLRNYESANEKVNDLYEQAAINNIYGHTQQYQRNMLRIRQVKHAQKSQFQGGMDAKTRYRMQRHYKGLSVG